MSPSAKSLKRHIKPPFDVHAWIKKLEALPIDAKAAKAVEKQIANRRKQSRTP